MSRSLKAFGKTSLRSQRAFAAVAHHLPHSNPPPPPPIWDTFVYNPTARSGASKIATSSRVTLDHPHPQSQSHINSNHHHHHHPSSSSSDTSSYAIASSPLFADWSGAGQALSFASDDELIHTLLLPLPTATQINTQDVSSHVNSSVSGEWDWHRTLDPALAFLALRPRASYPSFLRSVRPFIRSLYPRLRTSGVHQLFVSDLLLRHPDHAVLREVLEMDAFAGKSNTGSSVQQHTQHLGLGAAEKLRASLICSIYAVLGTSHAYKYTSTLSAAANLTVCRAMAETRDWAGLETAWVDFKDTSDHSMDSNHALLRLLVDLVPHRKESAVGLLSMLVTGSSAYDSESRSRLPTGVLGRKTIVDPSHPRASEILLRAVMVRSCLRWKLYVRAQNAMEDFLDVALPTSNRSGQGLGPEVQEAFRLLWRVCRSAIASADEAALDWVERMLVRASKWRSSAVEAGVQVPSRSRIPGQLVDAYVEARSIGGDGDDLRAELIQLYSALPVEHRDALSAKTLLRFAECGPSIEILRRLQLELFTHPPESISAVSIPFMRALLAPASALHSQSQPEIASSSTKTDATVAAQLGITPVPSHTISKSEASPVDLAEAACMIFLLSTPPLPPTQLAHIVRYLRPHKYLARQILEQQEVRLARTGRISTPDRIYLAEGYLLHGDRPAARRQLAGISSDDGLQRAICIALSRSPEIKLGLERVMGRLGPLVQ